MIGDSHSLKEKRMVLRRIKDRVRNTFNVAIAEVGDNDAWQSSQIGFAVVSNELGFTQSVVQKILTFIDELAVAKIVNDEKDFLNYGDEDLEDIANAAHWEPEEEPPPVGVTTRTPTARGKRPRLGVSYRDRARTRDR